MEIGHQEGFLNVIAEISCSRVGFCKRAVLKRVIQHTLQATLHPTIKGRIPAHPFNSPYQKFVRKKLQYICISKVDSC